MNELGCNGTFNIPSNLGIWKPLVHPQLGVNPVNVPAWETQKQQKHALPVDALPVLKKKKTWQWMDTEECGAPQL